MLSDFLKKRAAPTIAQPSGPAADPSMATDLKTDPWGLLTYTLGAQNSQGQSTPVKPEKHTVEPEIPGGPYHMVGGEDEPESLLYGTKIREAVQYIAGTAHKTGTKESYLAGMNKLLGIRTFLIFTGFDETTNLLRIMNEASKLRTMADDLQMAEELKPKVPGKKEAHGVKGERMTPEAAGYMELKGAVKDGDCKKVSVPGGVSFQLGCCNEFEAVDEDTTKKFSCGTCEYRKQWGTSGGTEKASAIKTLVGEGHMANENKSAREALREKLAALAESKKASQFGRLREVAKKEAGKVGEALGELAHSASIMATSFSALKENLDLNEAPRAASLKARVAARKMFANEFRRIAEANPEQLADSVIELYRSLDEIVSGVENFAANLGIELPGPEEEGLPGDILSGDGDEGLHGEMPIGGGEDIAPNPLEAKGERLETPAEEQTEIEEGTEGTEEDQQQDEELAKEAADAGSAGFVTDRDSESKPKTPEKAEVPRLAAKSKGATGAGGFVTNRDQSAEPKPVEKAEIPVSQGEAAITAALRDKAGW
jgi:hypothetical protein